jgi:UDP-3-O-[3-hydroxymyristoyl] glucosamine N-acyltransferase
MKLTSLVNALNQLPSFCLRGSEVEVNSFAQLSTAKTDNISFVNHPKFLLDAKTTQAGALVITNALWETYSNEISTQGIIICDSPYVFFAFASQLLEAKLHPKSPPYIHATALIDSSVSIADGVSIGAYVTVGPGTRIETGCSIGSHCAIGANVKVGANTFVYSHVTLYDQVELGENCIIHSGTVIGSDGFGFASYQKQWIKIPQTGTVIICNDVEIGSNCSIDRGALGNTIIGRGTKLDNLIQIAHNVQIGEDCAFAANIAIAGSAVLGNRIQIGGNAGVLGHLTVCDDVIISSCTLVTKTINKSGFYSGVYPIQENAEWEKNAVVLKRLSKMREQVRELEKQIKV